MKNLYSTPLDEAVAGWWRSIDAVYKKSFVFIIGVNLLAFGFEMTNLTLHHDDVSQIFIQNTLLGQYVGRFGLGWLHYYGQNAYFMPFLQMVEGILFMSLYGMRVAHFWGVRKTMDIVLIASILCVFPYMAQIYQYNSAVATYSLAHLLAALAVFLSTRFSVAHVAAASILYTLAFSIYQSVIANAATIFGVWVLCKLLFAQDDPPFFSRAMVKSAISALVAVVAGGLLYVAAVSIMGVKVDTYQSASQAFSLEGGLDVSHAISELIHGTRSFFFWPQHYFPDHLKRLQLVFLVVSAIYCLLLPKGYAAKISVVVLLVLTLFAPRMLQLLHPDGNYHDLTLTGYAVLIAGFIMVINRAGSVLVRNLSSMLAIVLIAGYILQCSWIATVNHLNMLAHYSTMTQILTRIKSLPDGQWNGKTIAVVGRYDMGSSYPYEKAVGVATEFIDPTHMQRLARLMREDVIFVRADSSNPKALEYATTHLPWPHPDSVGVVDRIGVVVLSKD